MIDQGLPERLIDRLQGPLPGPMIGSRFEPQPRPWHHYDLPQSGCREAAVLLLLYWHQDCWRLPLTLRPATLAAHAGQISLPGGAVEPGETTAEAAIREFHEELGADDASLQLLGRLSPLYVQASNFLVTPWVAATRQRPQFTPNPLEVGEVLEVPLPHLLDPCNFGSHPRKHGDCDFNAPHFLFGTHQVWGATCMILGEFLTILEEISGCGLRITDWRTQ